MNRRPSPAQIEAGNYAKDHVSVHGLRVSIENPAGSTRRGVGADGKPWASKMHHDYGYIRGTTGRDKDHVDVFLSDSHTDSGLPVHIVDQIDPESGEFDEHKVMLGWPDEDSAMEAYHKHYPEGWAGAKAVTAMSLPDFKKWAFQSGRRVKPVSELGVAKFCGGGAVKKYADGGAAFGVYPHMGRRREVNNDRAGSADMPFQALRGWAAGTAGLPGDLEGLARTLIRAGAAPDSWVDRNLGEAPALPNSEFYKEWLPGAPTGAGGRAAQELGSFTGGAGAGNAARVLKKGAAAATLGLGRAVDAGMRPGGLLSRVAPAAQPLYAVKPKGGNWDPSEPWEMFDNMVFEGGGPAYARRLDPPDAALTAWRDKQLQRYVHNYMGTADDPLLELERAGRLHLSPEDVSQRAEAEGHFRPRFAGEAFAGDKTHKALTGRENRTPWEGLSDSLIRPVTPEDARSSVADLFGEPMLKSSIADMIKADPAAAEELGLPSMTWLDKLPPDAKVWSPVLDANEGFAGFGHVNDYLKTALRAHKAGAAYGGSAGLRALARDFPENATLADLIDRGLHLSPDQLARTSVPDAVAKTHEWNKLLAEGRRLGEMNKGIKAVHRQYPSGNQWVELNPEGLSAEGQAMRHCVGGYCNSVERGDTRILSLRDKDGQPKVTVEVARAHPDARVWLNQVATPEQRAALGAVMAKSNPNSVRQYNHTAVLADPGFQDWAKSLPPTIRQIKGPANRPPSKEVLAEVQDLVRNGLGEGLGNWGEVGDLGNADLLRAGNRYVTPNELNAAYTKHYGGPLPQGETPQAYFQWLSRRDHNVLSDVDKAFLAELQNPAEGFKAGGKVALSDAAEALRRRGQNGDTILAHINPAEAALLKAHGGSGRPNPHTGLPAFGGYEGGGTDMGGDGSNLGGGEFNGGGSNFGDISYGDTGGVSLGGGFSGGTGGADLTGGVVGGLGDYGLGGDYGGTGGASLTGGLGGGAFSGVGSGYGNFSGLALDGPDVNQIAADSRGTYGFGTRALDFMLGLVPGVGLANRGMKAATDKSLGQLLSDAFAGLNLQGTGTSTGSRNEEDVRGDNLGALGSVLGAADMGALAPALPATTASAVPWADPLALGTHALRVYDPVFAPGTIPPRGY